MNAQRVEASSTVFDDLLALLAPKGWEKKRHAPPGLWRPVGEGRCQVISDDRPGFVYIWGGGLPGDVVRVGDVLAYLESKEVR
jgi:hypothetical protein